MGKHLVLTSRQLLFQKEFRLRAASVTPAWTREIVSTQLDHLYLSCILQKIFEQNGLNFGAALSDTSKGKRSRLPHPTKRSDSVKHNPIYSIPAPLRGRGSAGCPVEPCAETSPLQGIARCGCSGGA